MEPSVLERQAHPVSRRDIDPDVLRVLYRLNNAGYAAYLVGGSVRDLMMGLKPKDFDIATSAHPHQVRELFRNSRLIGRRFRLVHVFFGPTNIEVATFRRRGEESAADDLLIRHDNTFGTPEEDAFRRDFTVNASFYDPCTFRVIDFVGGVEDLRHRLIRTIGDAELRMREDPVRMIRAVRFAAKLDFEIEPLTRAAIERCADDLARASVPRLVEEIYRTLSLANSARALLLMEQLGLLNATLTMLSVHLKAHRRDLKSDLASAPTVRMMAALGRMIGDGFEPSHGFLIACLFADLYLAQARVAASVGRFDLCQELRARGFSRADTEQARLLLDALGHMLKPSRVTRRLVRRPYFPLVQRLFEAIAPIRSSAPQELDRFLESPHEHRPAARRLERRAAEHETAPSQPPRRRRRRGRRGGRRRSSPVQPLAVTSEPVSPPQELPAELSASSAENNAVVPLRAVDETSESNRHGRID